MPNPPQSAMNFRDSLRVHLRVVSALMLLELRSRYGKFQIGYLWALLEPLVFIVVLYGIFRFIGRAAPLNMEMETFLLSGIIPWRLFLSCYSQGTKAESSSRPLLVHAVILPFDVLVSRLVLEFLTSCLVFIVTGGLFWLFGTEYEIASLLEVITYMVGVALLGISTGHILERVGLFSASVEKAAGMILSRLLFFTSGLFFVIHELPPPVQEVILLNPMAHAIDLLREGFFLGYRAGASSPVYFFGWVVGLMFVSFVVDFATRRAFYRDITQ